ncbi:MAG: YtxH domain-containing protein [Flavobacteriaceae bacterium]|nr:YtxH domain-containing protein [Flavobacteriaceae bacterium]
MSSGKVVLGLLAGVAAGAIAGLLFAPDKGSGTRKKIIKKGKNYEKKLEKKFSKNKDIANKKFDKLKDEVSDFVERKMPKKMADNK